LKNSDDKQPKCRVAMEINPVNIAHELKQ